MKKAKPTTKTTVEKLETQHFSFDRPDLNGLRANLEVVDQVSQVLPEQAVQAVQAESGSKTASRNAPSPPKDKSVPTQPAVETGTSSKNTGKGKKSKTDAQNPHSASISFV
jgi:hypothetical protein